MNQINHPLLPKGMILLSVILQILRGNAIMIHNERGTYMTKLTKKEKEQLKNEISYRDIMTRKLIKTAKLCFLICLLFSAIAIWGFTGMQDNFLSVSDSTREILKWVGLVIAIPTGIIAILFYMSYHNSKKQVMNLLNKLEQNK